MTDLQPSGTVTLVFTDVEGSTKLLEELGTDAYRDALAEHRRLVREACARYQGYEVDYEGDAFFYAFASPASALPAVSEAMDGLEAGPIRIRVGIHTGEPALDPPKYVGMDVHRAARIMSTAHGGQVVLSPSTVSLLEPGTFELIDLGEHRLKDIEEAVSIFQLGDGSFPPLKTISNTNLPRPASSFVGREAELSEVLARIEGGAHLVTLTGPGGTGKTRLALEAASSLVPEYKAGVFWIGLASLRDAALVTETISQTLGAKDGLAEHIGERELLLLLDNLEQVIEAAPQLSALLSACPNLTLLVTSREVLRVQGEVEYPVPPLAQPEAVSLFCERAQVEPSDEIPELCARLDSLPLAVELAAARVKALSPAQILERLSQRLDLLKGGRDADPRQQTLRSTIEWSYDLLAPEEQQLFARLSVLSGGCTLEAAEEICYADLDTLQALVEKSLLRFTNERYWMLETIREYAGGRLAKSGEAGMLAQRHVQHFLELAETAEPELWAQHTDVWLPLLDPEEANFRAALGWSIRREEAEIAIRLAGSLYPFWEIRARHGEARAWLDRALALDGAVPPSCRAKALVAAARATSWQSGYSTAIPLLEEAAELSRKLNDAEGVGRCLGFIGVARLCTGDSAGAAAALNEGVELARGTGDRRSLARALYNAAWAAIEERDFDRARDMFEKAARIFRAEGMKPNLAMTLMRLGYSEALAGDFDRAASRLNEAVVLCDELGKTLWTPVAQRYLGLLALLRGKIDEAEFLLRTSLMEGRDQAPQFDLPHWIEELAAVAAAKGDAVRAATLWGATDALFERFGLATLEENRQVRERFREDVGGPTDRDLRAEAWAQGHVLTLQQAIAYALTEEAVTA
jgi:predicted ATPase/class 3 adenylate cyclase